MSKKRPKPNDTGLLLLLTLAGLLLLMLGRPEYPPVRWEPAFRPTLLGGFALLLLLMMKRIAQLRGRIRLHFVAYSVTAWMACCLMSAGLVVYFNGASDKADPIHRNMIAKEAFRGTSAWSRGTSGATYMVAARPFGTDATEVLMVDRELWHNVASRQEKILRVVTHPGYFGIEWLERIEGTAKTVNPAAMTTAVEPGEADDEAATSPEGAASSAEGEGTEENQQQGDTGPPQDADPPQDAGPAAITADSEEANPETAVPGPTSPAEAPSLPPPEEMAPMNQDDTGTPQPGPPRPPMEDLGLPTTQNPLFVPKSE